MEKIKNVSIIALSYLTICGSIYYLIFWKAFNLNGFSYMNFTDVVRSAIYSITIQPYAYYSAIIIFFGAYWEGTARHLGTSKVKILDEKKSLRFLFWLIVLSFIYIILANSFRSIFMFKAFPILIFLILSVWRLHFMEKITNSPIVSELTRAFIIFIPILCFVAAKVNSEYILQNIQYKYIIREKSDRIDTLKYLNNSGDNFIFTDMENKKVILLKLDTVTLYKK